MPQWLALGERCKGWAIYQLGDFEGGLNLRRCLRKSRRQQGCRSGSPTSCFCRCQMPPSSIRKADYSVAPIVVATGGLLWYLVHPGSFGTTEQILAVGVFCAFVAAARWLPSRTSPTALKSP
jgi:hypothetical protein